MDPFSRHHEIVNLFYFLFVMLVPMLSMNPVILLIFFMASLGYGTILWKNQGGRRNLGIGLFCMFFSMLFNPLFNHRGATILFYFLKNPITMESILFGFATGLLIAGMILSFGCLNVVMTSEKVTGLLGRISPKFALVISLSLRLIPKLRKDYGEISMAQRGLGGKVNKWKTMDCLFGISLEDTIDTADSMAARGYTLKHRRKMVHQKPMLSDWLMGGVIIVATFLMIPLYSYGKCTFFPHYVFSTNTGMSILFYVDYALIAMMPVILYGKEKLVWKSIENHYWKQEN